MNVIAAIAQKGGTGKTTTIVNMAVIALLRGRSVCILDCDQQTSAATWSDEREKTDIPVFPTMASRLQNAIAAATAENIDLCFVDTGGRMDQSALVAAEAATTIILPIQPTYTDLATVEATLQLIDVKGKRASTTALITRVKNGAKRKNSATEYLTANRIKVCPTTISDRVSVQDAFAAGKGIAELAPSSASASEFNAAYDHIIGGSS